MLSYFIVEFGILPLIGFLFYPNIKSAVLNERLSDFIPNGFSLDDILTNDVMFPAWDINNAEPVFLSNVGKEQKSKSSCYHMSFENMVLASAANPNYFTSADIDWTYDKETMKHSFFGGNTVSASPGLYAQFFTKNFKKIPTSKTNILTVGSIKY